MIMKLVCVYNNIDGEDSFIIDSGKRDKIKYFVLSAYDQNGNNNLYAWLFNAYSIYNKKNRWNKINIK